MIVGIFRSRLREEHEAAYEPVAERMAERAAAMPGFVSLDGFVADDGERVAIFAFETLAHLDAWRTDAEHLEAQRRGREEFYASYDLYVFEPTRGSHFQARD